MSWTPADFPRLLKEKLQGLYSESGTGKFTVNIASFGYKWGIPLDSDIVMDVRFITNPFTTLICAC